MSRKTVLIIDDERGFIEPLADALEFEGHRVILAASAEEGLDILRSERVDLVTVDIMMPPGASLEGELSSHESGLFLCRELTRSYPDLDVFCLSVVSDDDVIRQVQQLGVRFLRKGETPLQTVLNMIRSRLTGVAYSTEDRQR